MRELSLHSYNSKDVAKVKSMLSCSFQEKESWLINELDLVFQICDELIKNAFKANYKFLLLWDHARIQIMEKDPELSTADADVWLKEIFYSGESVLIEKRLEKIINKDQISEDVRTLMRLENEAQKRDRLANAQNVQRIDPKFIPLLEIKKQLRKRDTYVCFKVEDAGTQLLLSVTNSSPILESDFRRIQNVRERFKEYYDAGRPEYFFVENIDISGGGHGLGYALIDSILLQMGLEPEKSLYLVSATTPIVLLALPLAQPSKTTDVLVT